LLDQVIELGAGTIREWDVRAVKPRAPQKEAQTKQPSEPSSDGSSDAELGQEARDHELSEELNKQEEKWVMVCRPKAGQQVVGGGFLGLWRRMEKPDNKEPVEKPENTELVD
jgi:hypothetical protein